MDDQTLAIRHEGATLWVTTLETIRRRRSTAI
jgi:hypothetical protein